METGPGVGTSFEEGGRTRFNAVALAVGLGLLALFAGVVHWALKSKQAPAPRKVMQFTRVQVAPPPHAPRAPPPPPPMAQPKVAEAPQPSRVELKALDIPPDAPRPAAPAAGPLALAAAGDGPGDAFNLVGNPGGRGLLGPGGLGDGTGTGLGGGDDDARRFGWYYARIAGEIEDALRRHHALTTASLRVELRVWADASGRILRVQPLRATGRPDLEEALQSVVGLQLKEPPPPDLPMPMIARFTARRPQ